MPDHVTTQNLHNVIRISYEMLEIADRGDKFRTDGGCGMVYGILRDAAYKVRRMAREELTRHRESESADAADPENPMHHQEKGEK